MKATHFTVNVAITLILFVSVIILSSILEPMVQPVIEGDPSLLKPLKKNTVPVKALFIGVYALPPIVYAAMKAAFPSVIAPSLIDLTIASTQAVTFTNLVTEIIKNKVGRPRPFFLTLCKMERDNYADFDCTDVSNGQIAEARSSFPSGHTSTSFSACVIISLFVICILLQVDFAGKASIASILALLPLMLSTWVGRTRLTDYWHHYSDVIAGACLGTMVSVVTFVMYFHGSFKQSETSITQSDGQTTYQSNA